MPSTGTLIGAAACEIAWRLRAEYARFSTAVMIRASLRRSPDFSASGASD